jgi:hypothetical protein
MKDRFPAPNGQRVAQLGPQADDPEQDRIEKPVRQDPRQCGEKRCMFSDPISSPGPVGSEGVMDSSSHNIGRAAIHYPRKGAGGEPFQHLPILCRTAGW